MKLNGIAGTGNGKLGSMVFKTVAGEQVVSQYQPRVANPSTSAQVDQRSKMKLMSQVAAALAPVIAIPRNGLKSSRNLFIQRNFDFASANEGVAQVTYENLQLTSGNAGLAAIAAERSQANGVVVKLAEDSRNAVTRVVYILYEKTSQQKLQFVDSVIATNPGDDGKFQASLQYTAGDIVLFAYGMRDLNSQATARYGNYVAEDGQDIAKLVMNRNITAKDFQFTETRGTTIFADGSSTINPGEGEYRVFVTSSGNGTVSGAGVYASGTEVTVTATPASGYHFVGWRENGSSVNLSTNATYTFNIARQMDLVAVFAENQGASQIEVTAYASGWGGAEVTGAGSYSQGASVTVEASAPTSGVTWKGWKLAAAAAGQYLTTERSYTFTASENITLVAVYDSMQI